MFITKVYNWRQYNTWTISTTRLGAWWKIGKLKQLPKEN